MTTLNAAASRAALDGRGLTCATDVTGFGLLGHLYKLARASGLTAIIDAAAVPYLDGARAAVADGFVSRRNPPEPRLGQAARRRRSGRPRTSSCSSPTRRPRAAC